MQLGIPGNTLLTPEGRLMCIRLINMEDQYHLDKNGITRNDAN